ncbi:helix-turn-helix transcriptional regulator [Morganella morganii]|nr:helix-turn-helix transcriptional regulator [Morganella morganii]
MIMSNKTDNNLNTSINEMYKLIGGQIRKMRRITGVTSTELGNLIGVSQQQISRYEIGSTKISLEIILRISQVFGVSPYYFIEDSLLFFTRQHLPDDDNVIPRSTDAGVNTEPGIQPPEH